MIKLNEIKQYKLAETYIKFDFEYTEKNIEFIRNAYVEYVRKSDKLDSIGLENLIISIEFEEGSLKTKILRWGTIGMLYMGVANYGSFRSGLREIIKDVKWISEVTVNRIQDSPQIENHHVIRFERRLGIPGRLNEIYKRIDDLERNRNNYSNNDVNNILNDIKQDIADINAILDMQTAQQFLNDLPNEYSHNLPEPDPLNVIFLYNKYALKPKDEDDVIN